jgi:hypothetical protein
MIGGSVLMLVLCLTLGLACLAWFPAGRWSVVTRWSLALPFGWALVSILAGSLYFVAGPVRLWAWPFFGLALLLSLGGMASGWRHLVPRTATDQSRLAWLGAAQALVLLLLWLPALIGGPNYYAFRANRWDANGYDSLAQSTDKIDYQGLSQAPLQTLADLHPALVLVRENLVHDRLSTGAMLALLGHLDGGSAAEMNFFMAVLALAVAFGPIAAVAMRAGLDHRWAAAVGVALTTGFWATVVQNINAMSQMQVGSMGLLAMVGGLLLPRRVGILVLAMALAGITIDYSYVLPMVLGGLLLGFAAQSRRQRPGRKILAAVAAGLLSLVLGAACLRFNILMVTIFSKTVIAYTHLDWTLGNYFWMIDPGMPWRFVPAYWGLEPVRHAHAIYWGLGAALSAGFALALWRAFRPKGRLNPWAAGPVSFAAAGLLLAAILWLLKHYFPGAKQIVYAEYFSSLAVLGALARPRRHPWFKVFLALWVLVQFVSVGQVLARSPAGPGQVPDFPLSREENRKEISYEWEGLRQSLRQASVQNLAMDIRLPWAGTYAENYFGAWPLWRVTPLMTYFVTTRSDGLRMTRPPHLDAALVEKKYYPQPPAGAVLLAETPELALYRLDPSGTFHPAPGVMRGQP